MFGRLITAMVTPFTPSLDLDSGRIGTLVDHLLSTGTTALVAAGTTGESPTLNHAEKLRLFEETVHAAAGRAPVIAGTGTNDTRASAEFTREVDSLGVDGFLLVAPYYNRPTQEGLYRHFRTIAEATEKPVLIYNIPSRTAVNVDVGTVVRLAAVPNIVGVKESTGDFAQIGRLVAETPEDFMVYSGDDKFLYPMLALGAEGVVSVAAHVAGEKMARLIQAFFEGDAAEALQLHYDLMPLFDGLFRQPNPTLVKAALEMVGVPVGGVRLPLVDPTDDQKRELRRVLGKVLDLHPLH